MIASGSPAAPRGSSSSEVATGFGQMLAGARSGEGDEGPVSPEQPSIRPGLVGRRPTDEGSEPVALPGAIEMKDLGPQVLSGATEAKDTEAQILPGLVDAKPPEPQILPGKPDKDAGPLVLPGTVILEKPEPQVIAETGSYKAAEPLILPDGMTAKSLGPQVLPAAADGKAQRPQVLPASDPDLIAPPGPDDGDAGDAAAATRTGTGAASPQPHSLQPPPPPLKALAERTSKPLEDTPTVLPPSTDAKAAVPASPPLATADQVAKPAPQTAPLQAGPQADAPAPLVDEARSAGGGAATSQSEAPASIRDHSLSTLSRASIDATAQIAAQIQRRLEGRSTRFEIALRPAELGRVDVKLDIDAEGRLAARLAFDNPAAATDLRGRVDDLRRQLEAAGFELADDAFEFAERDSGSSAFDRGQDARHGHDRAFAAAARLKTEIDVAQPPQWLALSLSPSGVDMKV